MIINTGNSTQSNSTQPASVGATHTKGTDDTKAHAKHASASHSVTLSQAATQASSSSPSDAIDQNRVADIKQAVAEGRYSMNAERIAQKMLAHDELF